MVLIIFANFFFLSKGLPPIKPALAGQHNYLTSLYLTAAPTKSRKRG